MYCPADETSPEDWLYYEKSFNIWEASRSVARLDIALRQVGSLSKTTKLILLDSLLQEVCISSAMTGRSPSQAEGLS